MGAELFTNGIEWLGCRLNLSEGAVGSILAAVGTALPESIIPIVAIILSDDPANAHIGIGAILGAPFMLGTLALFITGLAARCFPWRGPGVRLLNVDPRIISRDFFFFILMYTIALTASFTNKAMIHQLLAGFLILAYFIYAFFTIRSGQGITGDGLKPLYCYFWGKPGLPVILFQVVTALALIIWGAHNFVEGIKVLAKTMNLPAVVLALIIAPIATELPEKFNSIIWLAQKKDTLALGNITGAMVFQSSLIPAIGMLFTPWQLNGIVLLSGMLVLLSISMVTLTLLRHKRLSTSLLISCGLYYLIFMGFVVWGARS
ncbi:MAG: sodium:calcium antiporter [Clostridia bacterium]|nr:sodium:calcium antiporter [Clostridia bacterium]